MTGATVLSDPPLANDAGIVSWPPFACPVCGAPAARGKAAPDTVTCTGCGERYVRVEGIWRFLTPPAAARYARFLEEYARVRTLEGRGAEDPSHYHALPFCDTTDRFAHEWRIRARSYATFLGRVVEPLERQTGRALRILDLGAGNCWLANRLTNRGHDVAAVDLSTDARDGLGAHRHYLRGPEGGPRLAPVQADFDALPFAAGAADLVVYNASLHYAVDYVASLAEALRVLTRYGRIVVLDSPLYRDGTSGRRMLQERAAEFRRRFGTASDALPGEGFLTYRRLDELATALGLRWQAFSPRYGMRWALRPWTARLLGRREPATFRVLVAERAASRQTGDGQHPNAGSPITTAPASARGARAPATGSRPPGRRRGVRAGAWRVLRRVAYLLFQRRRQRRPVLERVAGLPILVLPGVFNPRMFGTGEFLATAAAARAGAGDRVLELGTGAGAAAVAAAGAGAEVTAVDLDPLAVRCARLNALLNDVAARCRVLEGDLFGPVAGERFDLVLFNPPFFAGEAVGPQELAFRAGDIASRFAAGLTAHLAEGGRALVVLSTDGEPGSFLAAFAARGLAAALVATRERGNEQFLLYEVREVRPHASADAAAEGGGA